MNDIKKALMDYKYENEKINKWIHIFKRTKKERIKRKQFMKILHEAVKERKVIKCSDIVLMDIDVYMELERYRKELENIGQS